MLATPAARTGALPRGPQWAFEVKWDGVRALADTSSGRLRMWSRGGREVTPAYPELAGLGALPDAVLDGEVVLLADGRPSFSALAERMHVRDARRAAALARSRPVTYLAFDVLRLDGADVTARSYDERRALLGGLGLPERVQVSPVYDDGDELWAVTAAHGLEGVVAKRRSSVYRVGTRSADWVKSAHQHHRTALVAGWREETSGSGRLGAVLLGAHDDAGRLRYLGRAGSGLSGTLATVLRHAVQAHPLDASPFDDDVPPLDARGTRWCVPLVVVDTRYLNRTPTGRLRQPVVRGVRTDTDPDPWEQQ